MVATEYLGLPIYDATDSPQWTDTNNGFKLLDNRIQLFNSQTENVFNRSVKYISMQSGRTFKGAFNEVFSFLNTTVYANAKQQPNFKIIFYSAPSNQQPTTSTPYTTPDNWDIWTWDVGRFMRDENKNVLLTWHCETAYFGSNNTHITTCKYNACSYGVSGNSSPTTVVTRENITRTVGAAASEETLTCTDISSNAPFTRDWTLMIIY